jgi:hypothetical protein
MKKITLVSLVLLTLAAANAFACSATWTGPFYWNGATFYDYSEPQSCYSPYGSGTPTNTTLSCGRAGWQFGAGNYVAMRTSFLIPSNAPIVNPNHWNVFLDVNLVSPDQSAWDYFAVTVTVTHPNNTQSLYTIFTWNGTQGDLNGCVQESGNLFTANVGDTIMVEVRGKNLVGTATLLATVPTIGNQS